MQKVTMKDVAEKLNISTVTVSKALSDKEGVGEELRLRIKQTAERMGYRFNTSAKALKEGRNYNIGVIVADCFMNDASDTFYLKMYQNITQFLTRLGYSCMLELISSEMEKSFLCPNLVTAGRADGLIVMGQLPSSYLKKIEETGIKTVYLDFYDKKLDVDSVITDSVYGTYQLTNYIVSMGHKKIAFVGNVKATASILDRYLGYYRSLLVNDIELRADYIISDRSESGQFTPIELPKDMPTAFVCNCDDIAYSLMNKLKEAGYRIPEDVSVAGFDNYVLAEYSSPRLTTVEVNISEMAGMAVDLLIKKLNGKQGIGGRKVIDGKLIIRDSVGRVQKK